MGFVPSDEYGATEVLSVIDQALIEKQLRFIAAPRIAFVVSRPKTKMDVIGATVVQDGKGGAEADHSCDIRNLITANFGLGISMGVAFYGSLAGRC